MSQAKTGARTTHGRRRSANAKQAAAPARRRGPRNGSGAKRASRRAASSLAAAATRRTLTRATTVAGEAVRRLAGAAAATTRRTLDGRLPIQRSVDIAVPVRVAWEEWAALEFLPEGTHTALEIEREGATLQGRTDGTTPREWAAAVLDEREGQSFAWQSHDGGDCAGLVTFHRLSDRLTRLELTLDVQPTGPVESLVLLTRAADRRAEADLRRFKARLELINPDEYEQADDEDDAET